MTNAIGGRTPGVRPEIHKHALKPGDVLLVATDGLTRGVPDKRIAEILESHARAENGLREPAVGIAQGRRTRQRNGDRRALRRVVDFRVLMADEAALASPDSLTDGVTTRQAAA